MFNFGFMELLFLVVLGLFILGPKQFPQVVRNLLKSFNEMRTHFFQAKREWTSLKEEGQEMAEDVKKELSSVKTVLKPPDTDSDTKT